MNIKTFQAGSMAEALKLVKQQMGRDAVILHTRTLRRRGWLGFGGRQIVEVTASNEVAVRAPLRPAPNRPDLSPPPGPGAGGLLGKTYGVKPDKAASEPPPSKPPVPPAEEAEASAARHEPQLAQEMRQVRDLVMRVVREQGRAPAPQLPEKLFEQYLKLLEREVSQDLAEQVVCEALASLPADAHGDAAQVQQRVRECLAKRIPVDEALARRSGRMDDGRPLTIALIGPTGVGKTTTVAKLAATFKLRDGLRVGLITIDTYRIAAVDQLKTYAQIIDLPLEVVLTPTEMKAALQRLDGCDVVLIDTAGRGQKDSEKLDQLRAFIQTADPHETHLVLSSTCHQSVMMDAVEKFSSIDHDRIIFTKLDEAVGLGVLMNVIGRVDKRLSYVTTGQEVPNQIEEGRSDRLADLIMGAKL